MVNKIDSVEMELFEAMALFPLPVVGISHTVATCEI
jgi:hypothetical protein